jgi:hypothetical protein
MEVLSTRLRFFRDPGLDGRELIAQVILENGERLVGQEPLGDEI